MPWRNQIGIFLLSRILNTREKCIKRINVIDKQIYKNTANFLYEHKGNKQFNRLMKSSRSMDPTMVSKIQKMVEFNEKEFGYKQSVRRSYAAMRGRP